MAVNNVNISHIHALDLEIKLNKSTFRNEWICLGDFLYNSRLDPKYYQVEKFNHQVTSRQLEWISKNLESDDLNKPYLLFL